MKLIENTPARLVYSKRYGREENKRDLPGRWTEYSLILVLNAVIIIVVVSLLPALPHPLNNFVGGTAAAWVVAWLWMIYREDWKTKIRDEQIIVNKTEQELLRIYTLNSGEVRTHRHAAKEIHAFIAQNDVDNYIIFFDLTTASYGRMKLILASFNKETERDAMLHELTTSLRLSIES
jgi:hypothetical protein